MLDVLSVTDTTLTIHSYYVITKKKANNMTDTPEQLKLPVIRQKVLFFSEWYTHSLNYHQHCMELSYTSSSFSSMFGIPFVIGNFLPVSGQTRKPSFTSTCNTKQQSI